MATSAIPIGNPAGANQANPALSKTSITGQAPSMGASTVPAPIPGGTTPSSTNPYLLGGGAPGATTSGTVPSSTSGAPIQNADLLKQWTDIYGKGTGGTMASEYAGMQGTNSAAFQALVQSMGPEFAAQIAQFQQGMGASGVSPNSTVESLGLSNLLAQQTAGLQGADVNMILQNQQERLGLLGSTQQASEQEVASSGWDVFGQVIGDVGALAGTVMGLPGGSVGGQMFKGLFGGGSAGGVGSSVGGLPVAPSGGGFNF